MRKVRLNFRYCPCSWARESLGLRDDGVLCFQRFQQEPRLWWKAASVRNPSHEPHSTQWWQKGHLSSCHGHWVSMSLKGAPLFTCEPGPSSPGCSFSFISSYELRMTPCAEPPFRFPSPPPLCCFLCFYCKRKERIQIAQETLDCKGKGPLPPLASFPLPRGNHCYCFCGSAGNLPRI